MPMLLFFVDKTAPLLREMIPEVSDFKDLSLHEAIDNMRYSILPEQLKAAGASYQGAAGMAANQWGIKQRVFIFTPDGSAEGNRQEVMINPSYRGYLREGETVPRMKTGYEGCFSVPLTAGLVNRYEAILAQYETPEGKKIEKVMEGWEARVFQHETDHLDGKLFDGALDGYQGPECLERVVFKDLEDRDRFWQDVVKRQREDV